MLTLLDPKQAVGARIHRWSAAAAARAAEAVIRRRPRCPLQVASEPVQGRTRGEPPEHSHSAPRTLRSLPAVRPLQRQVAELTIGGPMPARRMQTVNTRELGQRGVPAGMRLAR